MSGVVMPVLGYASGLYTQPIHLKAGDNTRRLFKGRQIRSILKNSPMPMQHSWLHAAPALLMPCDPDAC